jgi:plasmid stabilization system protein ParE
MNLPIVLRDEARAEFDEAFDWYEAKRAGLALEFVAEIQKVFDRIAANLLAHQEVY